MKLHFHLTILSAIFLPVTTTACLLLWLCQMILYVAPSLHLSHKLIYLRTHLDTQTQRNKNKQVEACHCNKKLLINIKRAHTRLNILSEHTVKLECRMSAPTHTGCTLQQTPWEITDEYLCIWQLYNIIIRLRNMNK